MKASFQVLLSSLLCVSLATTAPGAQAELLRLDSGALTERERINVALQRPEIRARLIAEGVDVAAAEARVAALTDEEAALVASKFEELPAASGGNPLGLFFVALAVVVVIKLLPFILIGGGAVAAIKAAN